jgi:2',3'-cyclic-nucleotide 2'-phosphodiesterase (5'-nucleotidase family)
MVSVSPDVDREGSPDIANGSLTHWDIADGSLTDRNVADRSLHGTDIADDSLTGRQIDLGVVKVTAPSGPENPDQWKTAEVTCPATYSVIAGGGRPTRYARSSDTTHTFDQAHLASSRPSDSGQGWTVSANDSWRYADDQERADWRLIAYALCAKL